MMARHAVHMSISQRPHADESSMMPFIIVTLCCQCRVAEAVSRSSPTGQVLDAESAHPDFHLYSPSEHALRSSCIAVSIYLELHCKKSSLLVTSCVPSGLHHLSTCPHFTWQHPDETVSCSLFGTLSHKSGRPPQKAHFLELNYVSANVSLLSCELLPPFSFRDIQHP